MQTISVGQLFQIAEGPEDPDNMATSLFGEEILGTGDDDPPAGSQNEEYFSEQFGVENGTWWDVLIEQASRVRDDKAWKFHFRGPARLIRLVLKPGGESDERKEEHLCSAVVEGSYSFVKKTGWIKIVELL